MHRLSRYASRYKTVHIDTDDFLGSHKISSEYKEIQNFIQTIFCLKIAALHLTLRPQKSGKAIAFFQGKGE